MQRLPVNSPETLAAAVRTLRNDGVIAAPTETVYGLMAPWHSTAARDRIYHLKHRPDNKRLQMLIASLDDLHQFPLKNLDWVNAIARRFWPGPLTLIVETENGTTIGARIPDHPFILSLIRALGAPLAATSANLSGEPPASTPDDAVAHLDGTPDLLVDGGVVTVTGGTASTVASLVGRTLTILRPGQITREQLADAIAALP